MGLIVQKYGGTSVGDVDKIKRVARRILDTHERGNEVLVVVSAMGKSTDELYHLASQISTDPPQRELDMLVSTGEQISVALLAMAIHEIGHCWDSSLEGDYHPDGDDYWSDFKDLHRDSDSHDDYVRRYGETNRKEDWCTCWEAAMGYQTREFPAAPSANLQAKLAVVDAFFAGFA